MVVQNHGRDGAITPDIGKQSHLYCFLHFRDLNSYIISLEWSLKIYAPIPLCTGSPAEKV
jgi:hypothetical protein